MAHKTYSCPSLVLSCPDKEMFKRAGERDQEQVSANINASTRRLSDEKQMFQRRTRGSCNEEKPNDSEWSQPRATTSFAKKCEKITQVNRLGRTQRNQHYHLGKEIKARVCHIIVGNPACVKTMKPALIARGNPQSD